MRFGDWVELGLGALSARKLRTRLTAIAIAIGVGSVLVLTSLGEGARGWVLDRFAGLGSNTLVVMPGKTETRGGPPMFATTTRDLTLADLRAVVERVPGISRVVPMVVGEATIEYEGRGRASTLVGTSRGFLEVRHAGVELGSDLPEVEFERGQRVCVIGRTVRRELFGDANPLGARVTVGDYPFRVIGVLAQRGQSMMVNLDEVVLVPVANGMRMLNQRGLFRMLVQTTAAADLERSVERVTEVVRSRHRDEEDFTVMTPGAIASSLDSILKILTAALAGIAAVSLFVAGIGVMNVMVVSVTERTSEIGLMKAIGASSSQIAVMFLGEAIALSLAGGALGLAIGLAVAAIGRQLAGDIPFHVPDWAIALALGVSFGVGVVFGLSPALRAARLAPLEALRRKM